MRRGALFSVAQMLAVISATECYSHWSLPFISFSSHSFISFDFYSDSLSSGISVGHFERTKFIRPRYIHTFSSISNFILCKAQHTHICLSFYVVVAKMAFLSDFQPSLTQSVHLLAMYFTCMRNFLWNKSKTYRKDQGEKYYINRFENA